MLSTISGGSGGGQSTLESDSGDLILLGAITTRQLNLQGAGNGELRGPVNIGAYNLVLSGPGQWILSGTNSYTNTTLINGGTLLVNGRNTNNDTVTVNNGGTLGGAGLLTGPVTVNSGGTLAPGNGLGSLTISNTLALSAGSTTLLQLSRTANTNDSVRGLSSVSYGGTLQVTNLAGTLANGNAFKLFYADSYAGAFAALSPATPGTGLRWNTNTLTTDGTLRITNGPVPRIVRATPQNGRLVLNVTNGMAGAAAYVQFTTNLANPAGWVRLSTNAFDGAGGLLWSNQMVPGVPATFYRVEAP